MLKETFFNLLSDYRAEEVLISKFWNEIEQHHSSKNRHYHTLSHLENLLIELTEVKHIIDHWDTILFTLFYHDIVYNATKSDNEEKSAEFAAERMSQINVPELIIGNCVDQILATQKHLSNNISDTNYFLDADLSILGQDLEVYTTYFQNVRKEYSIYPNFLYKPGRKKALKHFLNMERIFKTDHFFGKFEFKAKSNLAYEFDNI